MADPKLVATEQPAGQPAGDEAIVPPPPAVAAEGPPDGGTGARQAPGGEAPGREAPGREAPGREAMQRRAVRIGSPWPADGGTNGDADGGAAWLPPGGVASAAGAAAVRRATATMFLSLVLIVMAFFIVLVAISKPDGTREAMALGSVAAAFAPPTITGPTAKPIDVDAGMAFHGSALLSEIHEQFATRLDVMVIDQPQQGRVLQLAVPVDRVFFPKTAGLRLAPRTVLASVARVVADAKDWTTVTILVPPIAHDVAAHKAASHNVAAHDLTGRDLAAARAGHLGDVLVAQALDRRAITVGIRRAEPRSVTFRFDVEASPPEAVSIP